MSEAFSITDREHMAHAIALADRARYTPDPNPRVGCVIVNASGEVVGEGWHQFAGEGHAEVHALNDAGDKAEGGTAYVTLEPCSHQGRTPPCCDALIDAKLARVVVAMMDPNPQVAGQGISRMQQAGIDVAHGLLTAEAEALNPGYLLRMCEGRPYVRCKLAMSVDGRTAMANGESKWITSPQARADVHLMRARSSAILTGSGTVLADDPSMTVRIEAENDEFSEQQLRALKRRQPPLRVIIDSQLKTPLTAGIFSPANTTKIFAASSADKEKINALQAKGVDVATLPATQSGQLDLAEVLKSLAAEQINEVMVEAGAGLAGALLAAHCVDELVIYMAPKLMGDNARGLLHLPALANMSDAIGLEIKDIRAIGPDWRITAIPVYAEH